MFLMRSMAVGGTQRQLNVLCREFLRRGHEVTVLLHFTGEPFDSDLQQRGVRIIDLQKRGRWDNLGFLLRLVRAVHAQKPDVLYTYLPLPNLLGLLLRHLLRAFAVVCGVRASEVTGRMEWPVRLTLNLERLFVLHADWVIVNSQAGARYLSCGKRYEHVVVIENGIEPEEFHYNEPGRRAKRALWRMADETPLVGCVARLDPMKDHATLLHAFALLRRTHAAHLICVGTWVNPYVIELQQLARRLQIENAVRWIEHESDLSALYSAFDALCLSSAYGEGFSNVLAEAMACGIPCVATDVGDARRILSSDDYLVPPRTPELMAHALAAALVQRRSCSTRRTEKILREFSVRTLADKTEAALLAAIQRKSRRSGSKHPLGGRE